MAILNCISTGPCIDQTFASCSNRFVFVNLDACMATQAVTLGVVERLKVSLTAFNDAIHACALMP